MIRYVRTIIWKEWREILFQRDRSRKYLALRGLIAAIVFGLMVWRVGLVFVDAPIVLIMPAYLLLFCVITMVADSFAGERERHTLETLLASRLPDESILLGKIASAVLLAWGAMFAVLICGLIEVNIERRAYGLIFPVHRLTTVLVFSLLLLGFVSCLGVLVSLRSSTVRGASQVLNITFMIVGFALLYAIASLPADWKTYILHQLTGEHQLHMEIIVALLFCGLDAGLLAVARAQFRRNRISVLVD